MSKRIFVAVLISEHLRKKIEEWERPYRTWPVRWLAGKDLHFTLAPPWYEEEPSAVEEALCVLGKNFKPFRIFLEKVSFGPSPHEPRLIWAFGQTPPEMVILKNELEKRLRMFDHRPFNPHLTLARFRPEDFCRLPHQQLGEKVFWEDEIRSFALIESQTLPAGARYDVLTEFKFSE